MFKRLFLLTSTVLLFGNLEAAPFLTIDGCARGYASQGHLHLRCIGRTGVCAVIDSGINPYTGQTGYYIEVNWACDGSNWRKYWLVDYPIVTADGEDTLVEGEISSN